MAITGYKCGVRYPCGPTRYILERVFKTAEGAIEWGERNYPGAVIDAIAVEEK